MRELMLEIAGGELNRSQKAPLTLLAGNNLQTYARLSLARRKGGKCKDRAQSTKSDQAKLASDLFECGEGLIEILSGVRSGDLATNASLALRDHRIAEASDKDPFR